MYKYIHASIHLILSQKHNQHFAHFLLSEKEKQWGLQEHGTPVTDRTSLTRDFFHFAHN